jgi:preprotein translocase subunit YajC
MVRACLARVILAGTLAVFLAGAALNAQEPSLQQEGPRGGGRGFGMGSGGGVFGPGGGGTMGTVTAISGNELTIQDDQKQIFKIETGPNSHIRKNREEAKISDIHVGDTVVAAGSLDEPTKTIGAVFVVVLDPQQAAEAEKRRATFGKTWTAGRITAIGDLTLTIERPDKVTQTIAVDENTTFHKGSRGQATEITFPDIHVGEMLRAEGGLQGNNFLATNVVVMEPRQPGEGRMGNGGPGGGWRTRQQPQPEGSPSGPAQPQPPNADQN